MDFVGYCLRLGRGTEPAMLLSLGMAYREPWCVALHAPPGPLFQRGVNEGDWLLAQNGGSPHVHEDLERRPFKLLLRNGKVIRDGRRTHINLTARITHIRTSLAARERREPERSLSSSRSNVCRTILGHCASPTRRTCALMCTRPSATR